MKRKKMIFNKGAVPTIYQTNVNMTQPPPITSATVSAPMKTVHRHTGFMQRQKLIQISKLNINVI